MNERSSQTLLRFLLSLERRERPASHLFFLGDIFDFWVGDHQFFYERFRPIVDVVHRIRKQGVRVEYFEGNHDLHLKRFWQRFDIPVWTEERYVNIGGLQVRLEHGDLINKADLNYLKFRSFVRHPSMEKLAYTLPGRGLQAIGSFLSHKSRERSSVYREEQESGLREMIRNHAVLVYPEKPFDVVISGHMHVRDDFKFKIGGRDVRSLNLGSWFENPTALHVTAASPAALSTRTSLPESSLTIHDFEFSWVELSGESAQGADSDPQK